MNVLFHNARILTLNDSMEIMEGELWVRGDEIVNIVRIPETPEDTNLTNSNIVNNEHVTNKENVLDKENISSKERILNEKETITFDRVIDCNKNLLMPGFKDAHTHSAMTGMRSIAEDLPLQEWLTKLVFPMEAKFTEEDIYQFTRLAILEYLTSGITACFDMYFAPKTVARACADMGMRCVLVGGLNNFSLSAKQCENDFLELNQYHPLISYQFGFHAEYTCHKELLQELAALSHKYKAPVYAHVSETRQEADDCREKYNMSPVEFLNSLGMFDYGGGIYHGIYVTDHDIAILKEKNVFPITNPGSNLKLASGIAPIKDYKKAGLKIAIGTDGPASNNCLDMFREMFLVLGLSNVRENDAAAIGADDVLTMATVNGAHAMRLYNADVLDIGKKADLIMLDLHQPNMQPLNNITKNIVLSGSKQNVKLTMINGNILYENNEFLRGIDPEEIYANVANIVQRLLKQI